jgi:CheY-like chemotaxis protein
MKLRAIVFDDDAVLRRMLREICETRGYEVFDFPDPKICPLHVRSSCPCPGETKCTDVIISDVQMSNVSGLDFVEGLLRKGCKGPHIALISGDWSYSDLVRAEQLGCKTFFKPFQLSQIVDWLKGVESLTPKTRDLCNLQEQMWITQKSAPRLKKAAAKGSHLQR